MVARIASRLAISIASLSLAFSGLAAGSAAWASDNSGLSSPSNVLTGPAAAQASAVPVDAAATAVATADGTGATTVSVAGPSTGPDLAFTVPDVSPAGKKGDYVVVADSNQKFAAYVKVAPNGGQVIFATQSPENLDRFSIQLKDPVVSQYRDSFGTLLATLSSGTQIAIAQPWARDASGKTLQTSYTVSGDTITQQVSVTTDTVYPVVADPAWTYVLNYAIGSTTPAKAKSLLHSCFNCRFPVAGAPRGFPAPGQFLPLTVGPWNFNCTFGRESGPSTDAQGVTSYGFYFNAARGHVDGVGSRITFSMSGGRVPNSLSVYGYVVNDNAAGVPRFIYLAGASSTWQNFANNLRNG